MDLAALSDEALLGKVQALAETERFNLIDLLIHLGELDTRTACEKRGYPSVFAYLTRGLGYAECDAMRRVRAARAARRYPSILRMLASGELTLVSVSMLWPMLTSENHQGLLRKAARRTTREVERLVAQIMPAETEPRDRIRALPEPASAQPGPEPADRPLPMIPAPAWPAMSAAPETPAQRRVVFTFAADEEVQSWFETARDRLRHRFPRGRMEEIIGEALRRLALDALPGGPKRPRTETAPENRRIPKWVKDEVWRRDSGRCAFVAADCFAAPTTSPSACASSDRTRRWNDLLR